MTLVQRLAYVSYNNSHTYEVPLSERWYEGNWYSNELKDSSYEELMKNAETTLLTKLREELGSQRRELSVVDLGPGNGKTMDHVFQGIKGSGKYVAIDINESHLNTALNRNSVHFSECTRLHGEFREHLNQAGKITSAPALWYFGFTMSNIDAFNYDIIGEITDNMETRDMLYVSIQTVADEDIIPVMVRAYHEWWPLELSFNIAREIGVKPQGHTVSFSSERERMEARVEVGKYTEDTEQKPGQRDTLITIISDKPRSFDEYVEYRFRDVNFSYVTETFTCLEDVSNENCTNRFDGMLLTKTGG